MKLNTPSLSPTPCAASGAPLARKATTASTAYNRGPCPDGGNGGSGEGPSPSNS